MIRTQDPLLCRMVRYCCAHESFRRIFVRLMSSDQVRMSKWPHEMVKLGMAAARAQAGATEESMGVGVGAGSDLLVEVLGIIAAFEPPAKLAPGQEDETELPWAELQEHGMLDLLYVGLRAAEEDVVLEAVMVIGLVARTREGAELL